MAISAKTRSRQVLIGEADAGGSLNDNTPGMHPGHELSELRNAPRQPAGETVIHYTRFAQISSFPDHPETVPAAPVPAPPMDAAVEKQEDEQKPVRRRVALSCAGSFFFHAALAATLFAVMPAPSDETLMEAGEAISVVMLGSSDADQSAAGETEVTIQEEVVPEAVEPDTVKPVETAEVQPEVVQPETVQPANAEPVEIVQPLQDVTRQSAETVATAEPEVLVSETSAETSVAQPMSTVVPEQLVISSEPPTAAAIQSESEEIKPVEAAPVSPEPEPPTEVVIPQKKPKLEKPVEKKVVDRKQPPKKTQGSEGDAKQESRRGAADGQADANSDNNSRTSGGKEGAGGASQANYTGKVFSRLSRCIDRLKSQYRDTAVSLRVRVMVNSDGNVTLSRITSGSGMADVDNAVLGSLNSCNLPALPDGWGASHTFDFPVQVTAR
ncbi:TonB family transporter protein [Rhizobium phaseoli]|uniref:Putative membrane protein, transduces energy to outer membrane receptors n=1 Tax=Rhizobium etli (strain CIAT 652) TaxID=491916 RepID=B3PX75_RHIE6|nr:TonB C-terminal domain-containing protein [Rhizobium phaseoli]ACE92456.1 putative membrane protein, transduces energy to outer membrane receptors [Rhizobium etli CIAT 652]MDH6646448.1 protein TonB [Rhizobium esperanzae]ANL66938.1 TonB family transporter protein [Rhizobium phaseoli]ANL73347.1 TonB family transporter protein [Rhizobium phaseoli]ANL79751.1 TonB family transporter protein [Rhizobium phaseoli]